MNTLASILAGSGGNPYQNPQGISPLLAQYLQAQYMQGQPPQGVPQTPGMPQQPQQQPANPMALGGLGTATGGY